MEIAKLLYGPIYASLGTQAMLTIDGAPLLTITAIDKTSGVEVSASGSLDVLTIKPAAVVRMSELASLGVAADALDGAALLLNEKSWRVRSHMLKPGMQGQQDGEVYLILSDEDV